MLTTTLLLLIPFLIHGTHDTGTSGGVNFNYLTGMPEALARPPDPGTSRK